MKLTSWLPYMTSRILAPLASDRKPRRGRRYGSTRPNGESLETRTLLSAVTWVGGTSLGGDLNWNNSANWNYENGLAGTPATGDDVTIGDLGGVTITVSGTAVTINSLHTSGAIDVSGTSFSLAANSTSSVNSTLRIDDGGSLNLNGATINGTGPLINAAGSTLDLTSDTINTSLENYGTLVVRWDVRINGTLTTGPGSEINLPSGNDTPYGSSILTVSDGFVNHGLIDLSSIGQHGNYAALVVQNGMLTNAADGTIRSSDPAGNGGPRRLYCSLDNRGLIDLSGAGLDINQSGQSTNSGTINVFAGDLSIGGGGLTNTGTGIIDIRTDGVLGGSGCPELINQGLFVKSGADGVTDLQMSLFNTGTVRILRGILNVDCGYVQTAGSTVATGGNLTGTVEIQGGAVQGNVPADYTVSGQLNVSPSPAPVAPANTYTQTSTGVLNEQIAGHSGSGDYGTPGTDYGQLVVNGDVALNGSFQVQVISPFVPSIGQQFLVIDNRGTRPIGGTFIDLPGGAIVWAGIYGFSVSYVGGDGNDFVLTMNQVANTRPIADAGGSYSVPEGGAVLLSAAGSSDAEQLANTLIYEWDLDGDGNFGESGANAGRGTEVGISPMFSAAGLDGPSTFTISVRVTDSYGQSAVADAVIAINNVAPTTPTDNNAGLNQVLENSPAGTLVGITAKSSDPGVLDTVTFSLTDDAGGRFAINSSTGVVTVANGLLLDYEAATSHSITVEASDGQGGKSIQSFTINLLNVTATISGTVFVDADSDGMFDGGTETAIDAVMIELYNSAGGLLDTDRTELGGVYAFTVNDEKGTYRVREIQPTGVSNGAAILGSAGGTVISSNEMRLTLNGSSASDYDFTEDGQAVQAGDTASIGFWQNKNGQALIQQGGPALVTWLNTNFGNIFGNTFSNGSGGDNAIEVASFYKNEFFNQKLKGTPKVDAQFMATALATFFTSSNLSGGNVAARYGFHVTQTGSGSRVVNIGSSGAAFGVANNTNMTIMSLLLATNHLTGARTNGYSNVYDTNGDGVLDDNEKALRVLANTIYSAINESGHIS